MVAVQRGAGLDLQRVFVLDPGAMAAKGTGQRRKIGPAREIIDPDWLAPVAVGAAVFILIYLAVTFVTSSLSKGLAKGEDVVMA